MKNAKRSGWVRSLVLVLLTAGLFAIMGCATDTEVERTTLPHVDDKPAAAQDKDK